MKKFKIVLYDDAIIDFNNALEYYRNISPSVLKNFIVQLTLHLTTLKKVPSIKYGMMVLG